MEVLHDRGVRQIVTTTVSAGLGVGLEEIIPLPPWEESCALEWLKYHADKVALDEALARDIVMACESNAELLRILGGVIKKKPSIAAVRTPP